MGDLKASNGIAHGVDTVIMEPTGTATMGLFSSTSTATSISRTISATTRLVATKQPPKASTSSDDNTGVVLGVLFGLVGLCVLLGAIIYVRRSKRAQSRASARQLSFENPLYAQGPQAGPSHESSDYLEVDSV